MGDRMFLLSESALSGLVDVGVCEDCGKHSLKITEVNQQGLSTSIVIRCDTCTFVSFKFLNKNREANNSHPTSVAAVAGALYSGGGYSALKSITSHLNMEVMTSNTFTKIAKDISKKSVVVSVHIVYSLLLILCIFTNI